MVWLLLAMPWGCRGWCGGELVPGAGCLHRLYRSCGVFSWISELVAGFWRVVQASPAGHGGEGRCGSDSVLCFDMALFLLSPAGRGGEGRRFGQGVLSASVSASRVRAQCRSVWKRGGCGEEAPWPCVFSDFGSVACGGRLLRSSTRVGVLPFPGVAAAWCLPLRRLVRRWVSTAGVAAVQRSASQDLRALLLCWASSALFFCVCWFLVCILC